jgi:hypothetical protein
MIQDPPVIAVSSSAIAGQFVWTGGTDSTWTDASNWTNVTPVSTDPNLAHRR